MSANRRRQRKPNFSVVSLAAAHRLLILPQRASVASEYEAATVVYRLQGPPGEAVWIPPFVEFWPQKKKSRKNRAQLAHLPKIPAPSAFCGRQPAPSNTARTSSNRLLRHPVDSHPPPSNRLKPPV